jgi:hypothetical protein
MSPVPAKESVANALPYHLRMRQLPACAFPDKAEKTYDRSFEHFARLVQDGKI